MISIGEASEWTPHGREIVSRHPQFDLGKDDDIRLGVAGTTLLGDEEFRCPGQETWRLEEGGEELYTKDDTAVLSSGGQTRKCFTLATPIHQALRCTFHSYPDRPLVLAMALVSPQPEGEPMASTCVRDAEVLRVYTDKGQEYNVALLFSVKRCWATKFGLLVERRVEEGAKQCFSPGENELDTGRSVLFFLLHPLEDYTRVVMKQGARMWEWQDQNSVIVHISSEPSICVTYNSVSNTHSVWRLRRATQLEADKCLYLASDTPEVSGTPSSHKSGASSTLTGSCTPSRLGHSTNTNSPSQSRSIGTPFHSRPGTPFHSKPGTPSHSRSQSKTNSPMSTMASMIRTGDRPPGLQSPNLLTKIQSRLSSPLRSPRSPGPGSAGKFNDFSMIQEEDKLPTLGVTIVLEHLWTEQATPSGQVKDLKGKASKVFFVTDLVGQQMLCLMRSGPNPGLQLVKMESANDNPDRIIFGAVRKIPAKDAAPISGLNMILVLDLTGSLVLYSGTSRVSKIMLPSSPTLILSQEISALALEAGPVHGLTDSAPVTPLNYKRSSLLTSSRPPSAALPTFGNLDSSVGFLSPVPGDSCTSITGLRDPQALSCTIQYNNSRLLTMTLPPVAGNTVSLALSAIKLLLPRELATLLHATWYNDRHAPGPCPAPDKEWDMFCRTLLGLAGYQVDLLDLSNASSCSGPSAGPIAKKCRPASDEAGCDGDWQQLLASSHHTQVGDSVSRLLGLDHPLPDSSIASLSSNLTSTTMTATEVNSSASLFPYIPAILWSLHLLYEEAKLDTGLHHCLAPVASLASQLASDLQLGQYLHHYWTDFPHSLPAPSSPRSSQLTPGLLSRLSPAPFMTPRPPSIISHLTSLCTGAATEPFPLVSGVTSSCELLTTAMTLVTPGQPPLDSVLKPLPLPGRPLSSLISIPAASLPFHSLALLLSSCGWDRARLSSLPASVCVPLITSLAQCQVSPPPGWSADTYKLIGREDLGKSPPPPPSYPVREVECPDGLEGLESEVSRSRWSQDQRLQETRRLLQSSRPVTVPVTQRPEVSDHEFVEEQEHYLKRLCERTMALSVGRGVAGLRTVSSLPTETLDIPRLCLTGRAPPRGAKVELSHIDVSHNMEHWPSFHNGVAAGLRLSTRPESTDIDSTWITFNKPKSNDNNPNAVTEHAGFLMALGLNGHLTKLGRLESFDYLIKGSEAISIGLLLGMSASKRGSMDTLVTKKLSTQLEALLPHTATELPLSHNTQVAALMGVGLLYSGTGHRRMVELCLKELGKPPGPELENCVDRESYSLTAGLSMGMIMMGKGEQLNSGGLADLDLPSVLHNHMVGGPRPSGGRERPHSYQIMEGDSINIDITSPGATLALAMMYWKSNNQNIANWMAVPETSFLLEFVRPDFLMLRTIGCGLILWDSVIPSLEWVEAHIPIDIRPHCLVRPPDNPPPGLENLDYETINQAYCNIIAGACFVLGLRFAGTWNAAAVDVLSHLTKKLIAITKRSLADLTGRAVIEQTVCVLVLAQGMVMAGSGDLGVMRTCRMLRARVHNNNTVTYGSHMAVHLALGLLFLGGGKLGLSNSPEAVAAMICAFYPKFPTHSSDNRYHLQALRHLYVLAVEPRVLVPRSSETGAIIKCGVELQYSDQPQYSGLRLEVSTPVLLPALSLLSTVSISDQSHWTTVFRSQDTEGWDNLRKILSSNGDLAVKRKTGAGLSPSLQWSLGSDLVTKLRSGPGHVATYLSLYLSGCPDNWSSILQCLLSSCLASATPDMVPVWTSLLASQTSTDTAGCFQVASQIQTLMTLARHSKGVNHVNPEMAMSLAQKTNHIMDQVSAKMGISTGIREYLSAANNLALNPDQRQVVSSTIKLHSLPSPDDNEEVTKDIRIKRNPLKLAKILRKSSNPASLYRML